MVLFQASQTPKTPRSRWKTKKWHWLALAVQNQGVLGVQFSSVAQSCPTFCDPVECSMPGFPVHHQLPEPAQIHVHWVSDVIQPSHVLVEGEASKGEALCFFHGIDYCWSLANLGMPQVLCSQTGFSQGSQKSPFFHELIEIFLN